MELAELARRIDAISARYAQIYGFERDGDWLMLKAQEEVGELAQAWLAKTGRQRDKGRTPAEIDEQFALELADAIGMLLALAQHTGVDVERAMDAKWLVWDRRVNQRDEELDDDERALVGEALRGDAASSTAARLGEPADGRLDPPAPSSTDAPANAPAPANPSPPASTDAPGRGPRQDAGSAPGAAGTLGSSPREDPASDDAP